MKKLIGMAVMALILFVGAREARAEVEANGMELLNFRGSLFSVTQDGKSSGSFMGSWNPVFYAIAENTHLGAVLAASTLEYSNGADFGVFEAAAVVGYSVSDSVLAEFALGAQKWDNGSGTHALVGVNANYMIPEKFLNVIDRVWAGYAAVFHSDDLANQLKVGLGVSF